MPPLLGQAIAECLLEQLGMQSESSKPQIVLKLLQKAEATGAFTGRWVGVDSFFGSNPEFLDAVGEKYYYFADIRSNTQVWLEDRKSVFHPTKVGGPIRKRKGRLQIPCLYLKLPTIPHFPGKL